MAERIQALKEYILTGKHHALRRAAEGIALPYRDPSRPDFERTALRLETALRAEEPVLLPGERLVFTRTLPALPMIYSDGEWAAITKGHYIHEKGNVCNLSPDYGRLIREGLACQLEKLDRVENEENRAYLSSMRRSIQAVLDLVKRYEALARSKGLSEIADRLARVPAQGASNYPDALQSLRILHYAMWCEGDYHNTLGRFDQYMFPYFQKSLSDGMTEEEALEWTEEFFLACNRDSDLYPGMQQGDNGQSMVLGGYTAPGVEGFNKLSELCIRASASLRVIDPKINLRVTKDTPLSVYELGTQLTRLGLGFPQYENDEVAIPALMRLGYEEQDAYNYVVAACWEFIIPGRGMDIPNIGALPFAGLVSRVIREHLTTLSSMGELKEYIHREIFAEVRRIAAQFHDLYVIPSPYISLFFDGCLEKARDISLGNRYNNFGLHGTGLATAADCMAAVEEMVFNRHTDPQTLLDAMDANFVGYDGLRHVLKHECPKMGNDEDGADQYASFLLDTFALSLLRLRNERGGIYRAGTGSAMYYIWHAADLGATIDGRLKEEPLPANYAPALNTRVSGPASLIRSFTKPDLSRVINGGPLTIEFHDSVFREEEAITKVAQLVRYFVQRGGHQLQLNTVNRDQLLDAKAHPENYRNLIVRVWGWSGYFVELDECYQDHIIERVELAV